MEQRESFADDRWDAFCAYCGEAPDTRDHVPSRVLLNEPYPENLPIVSVCQKCNNGLSLDEEYVACLIECAITGTTCRDRITRPSIRAILDHSPALAARLMKAFGECDGIASITPEADRVRRVIVKLARGHAAFELSEPMLAEPDQCAFMPFVSMDASQRTEFENPPVPTIWPEVGSRMLLRQVESSIEPLGWMIVQPDRYRYLVSVERSVMVRGVLSEYLAFEVIWGVV